MHNLAYRCLYSLQFYNFLMNDFASQIVRQPHQYQRHLTAIVDINQSNHRGAQEGKSYTTFAFPSNYCRRGRMLCGRRPTSRSASTCRGPSAPRRAATMAAAPTRPRHVQSEVCYHAVLTNFAKKSRIILSRGP